MQDRLVGTSSAIRQLRSQIDRLARCPASVLITGESGVGKEVVAKALYDRAPRGQFVPIDCVSLASSLVESELFGYVAGAFTGAMRNKEGLISAANGGVAFFDELGDMPLPLQGTLLRVLQEREYRPLGAVRPVKVNFRAIAATNRNLPNEIKAGRFREDLFYRLNVISLYVPPLRERREDIHVLAECFLQELGATHQLGRDALGYLEAYDWPGNIRELHNCIEYMVAMATATTLTADDLPLGICRGTSHEQYLNKGTSEPESEILSLRAQERRAIAAALERTHGDRAKAALLLGIGRTTLYRKMGGSQGKKPAARARSMTAAA